MSAIIIIPARYNSSRFPGKPLAMIADKTMIRRVYERAKRATQVREAFVATDDSRIAEEVLSFGGKVCMTSSHHTSGTDRIAEAIGHLKESGLCSDEDSLIINVQGDEPLIDPQMIDSLVELMKHERDAPMATLLKLTDSVEEINNPNVVKAVFDKNMYALYFSRSPIPYQRTEAVYYKHIGLYAYKRDFLGVFTSLHPTPLEQAEQLEQLRALEHGYKIKVAITTSDTIGVDTPEDLKRVEQWIKSSSL